MGHATPKKGRESDSYDASKAFETLSRKYKVTYNNAFSSPNASPENLNEKATASNSVRLRDNKPLSTNGDSSSNSKRKKGTGETKQKKASSAAKKRKKKKGQSLTYSRTKVHRLFRENLKEIRSGRADELFYEELRSSAKATVPYGQYGAFPAKKIPSEPFIDPDTGETIQRRCSNCTRSHFEGYCGQMGVCSEWEYSRPTPEWYPSRDDMKEATRKELAARHRGGDTDESLVSVCKEKKKPASKQQKPRSKVAASALEKQSHAAKRDISSSAKAEPDKWIAIMVIMLEQGCDIADYRSKGGALWVMGSYELKPVMDAVEKEYGVKFYYSKKGGKASGGRPAWYAK